MYKKEFRDSNATLSKSFCDIGVINSCVSDIRRGRIITDTCTSIVHKAVACGYFLITILMECIEIKNSAVLILEL